MSSVIFVMTPSAPRPTTAPWKKLGSPCARQLHYVAGGGDDFERGDGGGEVAVFFAGAVSSGRAGSGDGNVRERGEIVEGEAFGVEERGELAVGNAGVDGDGAGVGVERDDFVERLEGEESVFAVGDIVEAVAGAEDFKFGMSF